MGKQGAIRKDGSEGSEEQADEQQPVLSERERVLQEIDEEMVNVQQPLIDGQEPEDSGEEDQQLPAETEEKPQMVKVKVDGVEKEMPIDEVIRGYQKDSAASKRLQEAAEKERELQKQREELEQLQAQMQTGQGKEPENSQPSDNSDDDEYDQLLSDTMYAVTVGDDEEAKVHMKELLKRRDEGTATQKATVDAVAQEVEERLEAKRAEREQESAFKSFLEANPTFADVSSPQRKYGDYLFQTELAGKIEAGELSYQEALNQAAAEASRIYGPGEVESAEAETSSKAERKKAIDNVPVAGGRATAAAKPQETTDDVISEMRKMRGQIT